MLAAVTLDFWGTLARDSAPVLEIQRALRVRAVRTALAQGGAVLSEDATAEAYERAGELMQERFWQSHRDPGLYEQVRLVLDCAAPGVVDRMSPAQFEEAVEGYIAPTRLHPPDLLPGAADAVRALAGRGVALGVISNTGRTPGVVLRQVLASHDLLRYFKATCWSDETGCRKPDAAIFRLAMAGTGAREGAAAHVGDNPVDDVAGARGAGMLAVHYTGSGQPAAAHADLVIDHLGHLADGLFRLGG